MPDITTIRGDSRLVGTPVFDDDLDRFRTETELASAQAIEYKVSDSAEDSTTYITKDFNDTAVQVTNPTEVDAVAFDDLENDTGLITVKLTPTDTQDIPAETLWHEIQITDSNGNDVTVLRGEFNVLESATNP